jgi:hypothetical protein
MRMTLRKVHLLFVVVGAMLLLGAPSAALSGHFLPHPAIAVPHDTAGDADLLLEKHQQSPDEKDDVDGGHEHGLSITAPIAILECGGALEPPLPSAMLPAAPDPDSLLLRAAEPPLPRPPSFL